MCDSDESPIEVSDDEPRMDDDSSTGEEDLHAWAMKEWHERQARRRSVCMFCPRKLRGIEPMLKHFIQIHNINMLSVRYQLKMDDYGWIQLVNFTRKTCTTAGEIIKFVKNKEKPWADADFYRPTLKDDLLLQWEPDELAIKAMKEDEALNTHMSPLEQLQERMRTTEERARLAEEALYRAMSDLKQIRNRASDCMKKLTKHRKCRVRLTQSAVMLLGEEAVSGKPAAEAVVEDIDSEAEEDPAEEGDTDPYFLSYANVNIHREMLQDTVRTEAYRDFMMSNPDIFKDKVVLDVGCGTGILSIFAAKAGAAKVYAVDRSSIAYQAMAIVKENKLDHVIEVMRGRVEDIKLTREVDVIISEWMGYFLLYEAMFDSVISARDKLLHQDGYVFPGKVIMKLVGLDDKSFRSKLDFWDDVYGFSMSTMKNSEVLEADVVQCDGESICTTSCAFKEFDTERAKVHDLEFQSTFGFDALRDTTMTAIAGYFDTEFALERDLKQVKFSCSPAAPPTHWKQSVFVMNEPWEVKTGWRIEGDIEICRQKHYHRALHVQIRMKLYERRTCVKSQAQDYVIQ